MTIAARSSGFVGKTVTFDTGGISLKPAAGMPDMKMDMSGGAAVLEATAAIAELGLAVDLVAVLPAVENMPGGGATRPGDIITQLNGLTVEVNNTDAEGRLILADALTWCERQGAERIVDVATLTGAVVVALGSTYAGLMANDDDWADEVAAAGGIVGELAWRLPLHREYTELTRGKVADLSNSGTQAQGGHALRGRLPRAVRRGRGLGPPRHRRDRVGRRARVRRARRQRLRGPPARRARPQQLDRP